MPDPVGATTSAWSPPVTASHAPTWAGVGPEKAAPNQARVAVEKRPSTTSGSSPGGGPSGPWPCRVRRAGDMHRFSLAPPTDARAHTAQRGRRSRSPGQRRGRTGAPARRTPRAAGPADPGERRNGSARRRRGGRRRTGQSRPERRRRPRGGLGGRGRPGLRRPARGAAPRHRRRSVRRDRRAAPPRRAGARRSGRRWLVRPPRVRPVARAVAAPLAPAGDPPAPGGALGVARLGAPARHRRALVVRGPPRPRLRPGPRGRRPRGSAP